MRFEGAQFLPARVDDEFVRIALRLECAVREAARLLARRALDAPHGLTNCIALAGCGVKACKNEDFHGGQIHGAR